MLQIQRRTLIYLSMNNDPDHWAVFLHLFNVLVQLLLSRLILPFPAVFGESLFLALVPGTQKSSNSAQNGSSMAAVYWIHTSFYKICACTRRSGAPQRRFWRNAGRGRSGCTPPPRPRWQVGFQWWWPPLLLLFSTALLAQKTFIHSDVGALKCSTEKHLADYIFLNTKNMH